MQPTSASSVAKPTVLIPNARLETAQDHLARSVVAAEFWIKAARQDGLGVIVGLPIGEFVDSAGNLALALVRDVRGWVSMILLVTETSGNHQRRIINRAPTADELEWFYNFNVSRTLVLEVTVGGSAELFRRFSGAASPSGRAVQKFSLIDIHHEGYVPSENHELTVTFNDEDGFRVVGFIIVDGTALTVIARPVPDSQRFRISARILRCGREQSCLAYARAIAA